MAILRQTHILPQTSPKAQATAWTAPTLLSPSAGMLGHSLGTFQQPRHDRPSLKTVNRNGSVDIAMSPDPQGKVARRMGDGTKVIMNDGNLKV